MEQRFTEIKELGEFKLIDRISKGFSAHNASTIKAIGDDCALIDTGSGVLAISTDQFTSGVHFDLTYTPLPHLGYKCVVAAISDVYAMNLFPSQILVSISMSSMFSVEMVDAIYEGISAACKAFKVDLVGGDTTASSAGLTINVTAFGQGPKDQISRRSNAQPGDVLMVSGDLGAPYIGLQLLEREKKVFMANPEIQPDLDEENQYVLGRHLRPDAREDIIQLLSSKGVIPNAMIDISDGLSSELLHICTASNTGCLIEEARLPIHPVTMSVAEGFKLEPTMCALNGGEEFELLFAVTPEDADKLSGNPELTVIGHVLEESEGRKLLTGAGNKFDLRAQGWEAFGSEPTEFLSNER